ncbi:MAG: DUF1028 domain-containing protein [Bacteroidetes bacterium]|nr:DUF1028 domain-containing protein [Bacteroidota bacterium]
MKKQFFFLFPLTLIIPLSIFAQDTFSIVAVDSVTGEVGSAGATCLQAPNPAEGALFISDVIPGLGAMHTQALWESYNQQNGHTYMISGYMPEEILHEVNISDIGADSTIRQYGIALFDANGSPRTAAYTGVNCYDYKGQIVGYNYAIQGNIIINHALLDSIESGFLNTPGSLADKLMAAMQGANIPGADIRCLSEGVPSKSAFLRVAKPTDHPDSLSLHLVVKSRPDGMSPIDSLQTLFNEWKTTHPSSIETTSDVNARIWPNPASSKINIQFPSFESRMVSVTDMIGRTMEEKNCTGFCNISLTTYPKGMYFIRTGNSAYKFIVR